MDNLMYTISVKETGTDSLTPHVADLVFQNNTPHKFFGWIPATVAFGPGGRTDLGGLGIKDRPSEWKILKKHADGSIALAQVKAPFFLQPNEMAIVAIDEETQNHAALGWHENVLQFIRGNNMLVELVADGDHVVAAPLLGKAVEIMTATAYTLCVRTRSVFTKTLPLSGPANLTLTSYIKIEAENPIMEVTFVVGNDQRDVVVPQGVPVSGFNVITNVRSAMYHAPSYGALNETIGDGQTMAVKYFINTAPHDDLWNEVLLAKSKSLFIGTQVYEEVRALKAFSTGGILPAGIDFAEIPARRLLVEQQYTGAVTARAKDSLGYINYNPPSTGNQQDFSGCMPTDVLKAMQVHSQALFSRMFTAVMRECWRPSFFWNPDHTRPTILQNPSLFFWSGRPHYDRSWNPESPAWTNRCGLHFDNFGVWAGMDNQHWGNNHLRAMYELTGDEYLGDICNYYMSLVSFNYLTKWISHGEAERTTRSFKDAYALAMLFRGTPVAQHLFSKLEEKGTYYDQEAESANATYGIPSVGPADACDPRVLGGQWCPASGNKKVAAMAWQAGFHMEADYLRANPSMVYLDKAHVYFLEDGTPKMYINMLDPVNNYSTAGFSAAWLAGWVLMAERFPNHPNSAFILAFVKPKVEEAVGDPSAFGTFLSFKMW